MPIGWSQLSQVLFKSSLHTQTHMLSDCSRRSSPSFLRKKATQLLERSKTITSNGHLCTLELVPFYVFTPPMPSLVAERWRYSPPHQLRRCFSVYKEQYHSTALFYVEYGEIVVQTTCAYGNYHPQTLASFTGTPKGSIASPRTIFL